METKEHLHLERYTVEISGSSYEEIGHGEFDTHKIGSRQEEQNETSSNLAYVLV